MEQKRNRQKAMDRWQPNSNERFLVRKPHLVAYVEIRRRQWYDSEKCQEVAARKVLELIRDCI